MPTAMTEQLLQQHYNQMEHLNQNMQRHRQAQEKQLGEKMQFMKKQKEQWVLFQLEIVFFHRCAVKLSSTKMFNTKQAFVDRSAEGV